MCKIFFAVDRFNNIEVSADKKEVDNVIISGFFNLNASAPLPLKLMNQSKHNRHAFECHTVPPGYNLASIICDMKCINRCCSQIYTMQHLEVTCHSRHKNKQESHTLPLR